jgi:GNAT superfamily N-acetyltransferase
VIRHARPDDVPALRGIWKTCFGDADTYLDLFFSMRFAPCDALLWEEAGAPVAVLYQLPAVMRVQGRVFPVHYIYAAATLPACRGRGIMGALLSHAFEEGEKRGDAYSFLRPGEPGLYDYYARFGYRTAFFARTLTLPAQTLANVKPAVLTPLDAAALESCLKSRLLSRPFTPCWGLDACAHLLAEMRIQGGDIYAAGTDGLAAAIPAAGVLQVEELLCEDDTIPAAGMLRVKELLCEDGAIPAVLAALLYRFPQTKSLQISLPAGASAYPGCGELVPSGMLRPLGNAPLPAQGERPYLSFAMD